MIESTYLWYPTYLWVQARVNEIYWQSLGKTQERKDSPYRPVVGEILIRWKYLIPKVIVGDPVGLKQSCPG